MAQSIYFTEYPSGSGPYGITAGPDGALWFTELYGNKVGRISTAGVVVEFPVPTSSSGSRRITAGPDGALWFTERDGNKIGRITTAGVFAEYPVPTAASWPQGITAGPDGAVWFTEQHGNKIGRITTAGVITEFLVPTSNSGPFDITTGPDGALWFTEYTGGKIGRSTTAGVITEFVPDEDYPSNPYGITAGPDGALWFTLYDSVYIGHNIGRITITGVVKIFQVGHGPTSVLGITSGPDGALWFTETDGPGCSGWCGGNRIGRITTGGRITEFPVPAALSPPSLITTGPDGALWLTAFSHNTIGRTDRVPCTVTLSAGGQAFPAAGGSGTISVTAPQGCAWGVFGFPGILVTFTSPTSGSGNGTIHYQVEPNTDGGETNTIRVAGGTFTIEQAGVISGLNAAGSLAHVTSQGSWIFTLDSVNLGASSTTARFNFSDNNGNALMLPLTFPQLSSSSGPMLAATLDRPVNPNAQVILQSTGPASTQTIVGSGQMLATGSVSGFGIFSYPAFGWNAVVPLETRKADKYYLAFDNTGSLTTGIAIANLASSASGVTVIIRDDSGTQIGAGTINLSAQGHLSFMLNDAQQGFPVTANRRGAIEFQTPPGGQISVLGLRANGPALTTLPVLASTDAAGGAIAHATYNGGFTSTFYLVNTGTSSSQFTLNFFDENGNALTVPLRLPQTGTTATTASLTQTLAAGAMLVVETVADDKAASVVGSAQLSTVGSVSGFEIFKWTTFGQEASVPLETRTPGSFVLVFDDTNGLTTGVAISNVAPSSGTIAARIYDDSGKLLQTASVNLVGHGHTSFLLPDNYPLTANKRGMVEFVVPVGGKINAVGLRAKTDGTLTTIPILTK